MELFALARIASPDVSWSVGWQDGRLKNRRSKHAKENTMIDSKKLRQARTKDKGPIEKTKKLPAAFPDKLDKERDQKDNSADQKRGTGARFHGSM